MLNRAMDIKPSNLQFSQDNYVIEQVIRLARWFGIGLILVTFPFETTNIGWASMLIVLAVVINGLNYTPWLKRLLAKIDPFYLIVVDYTWILVLILLTGGFFSPYYFFILFPIIVSACWYGGRRLLVFSIISVVATFVLINYQTPLWVEFSAAQRGVAYIMTIIICGVLIERLTFSQRNERDIALGATKRAETERNRLISLINSMSDAVIATNRQGVVSRYNGAALDILNTNTPLTNLNIQDHITFLDAEDKKVNLLKQVVEKNAASKRDDLHFIRNNGEHVSLYVNVAPIFTGFGHHKDEGFIFMLRDITKEKSLDEQRDEFIAVTSHELRTPLAIAEANISTALLPQLHKLDPTSHNLIKQAHDNIIFLGRLVNDLTTLAAVDNNKLDIEVSVIDPAQIVERLANNYRPLAKEKGLKFHISVEKKLPQVVSSGQYIQEILQNLLTNALKYTEKGTVTLKVGRSVSEKNNLTFSVLDTGIGISKSDQKRLFTKFYRSEDYRTRTTGGTGLGLYITRKLAQRLNGRIWLESQLNKGTTFYFEVPPFSHLKEDRQQVIGAELDNVINKL